MLYTNATAGLCQALMEKTGQAFFAYDRGTGCFSYLSPTFLDIFRVEADKFTPQTLLSVVNEEDIQHLTVKYSALLEEGESFPFEFRIRVPGQEEQWLCVKPMLWEEASGKQLVIGHARDITSERRYSDNLKKFSNKQNSILNIISHDLAGPLALIQSLCELLTDHVAAGDNEKSLQIINLIRQSSRQGSRLIQEFINQEFLESSQVELITHRVNLVEKIREVAEAYQLTQCELVSRRFEFKYSVEEIYTEIDDFKFMQVVNNLISNALKFTPEGGVIMVELEEEEQTVLLKVSDTGVGIPEKFHASLFDKFTKARRPGLKGEPSIGLGMSIIKTIVEWHRGEIWFKSQEGKGTTFFIRLPKH